MNIISLQAPEITFEASHKIRHNEKNLSIYTNCTCCYTYKPVHLKRLISLFSQRNSWQMITL